MATYRVTFDVINPKGGRAVTTVTVEAESDFMAARVAEGKVKSQHTGWGDRTFNAKKIEKVKK